MCYSFLFCGICGHSAPSLKSLVHQNHAAQETIWSFWRIWLWFLFKKNLIMRLRRCRFWSGKQAAWPLTPIIPGVTVCPCPIKCLPKCHLTTIKGLAADTEFPVTVANILSSSQQIRWDGRVNKADGHLGRKGWDFWTCSLSFDKQTHQTYDHTVGFIYVSPVKVLAFMVYKASKKGGADNLKPVSHFHIPHLRASHKLRAILYLGDGFVSLFRGGLRSLTSRHAFTRLSFHVSGRKSSSGFSSAAKCYSVAHLGLLTQGKIAESSTAWLYARR